MSSTLYARYHVLYVICGMFYVMCHVSWANWREPCVIWPDVHQISRRYFRCGQWSKYLGRALLFPLQFVRWEMERKHDTWHGAYNVEDIWHISFDNCLITRQDNRQIFCPILAIFATIRRVLVPTRKEQLTSIDTLCKTYDINIEDMWQFSLQDKIAEKKKTFLLSNFCNISESLGSHRNGATAAQIQILWKES